MCSTPVTDEPFQVPLQNRSAALDEHDINKSNALQGKPNNNHYDSLPNLHDSQRLGQSKLNIKTSAVKNKRHTGDLLLKDGEGHICRPNPLLREVC